MTEALIRLLEVRESVLTIASALRYERNRLPCQSGVIEKTIHSIFARKRFSLGTIQELKPVPMVEHKNKNKLE